jgi:cyclophilin family peptidyl-prolyl cis-trans isomerase
VPSDKRARQRAAREERLAAEAKAKKRRKQIRNTVVVAGIAGIVILIVFLTTSNSPKTPAKSSSTTTTVAGTSKNAKAQAAANTIAVAAGCPASTSARVNTQKYAASPAMTIDTSKTYTATVTTDVGPFTITLDPAQAPKTVNNFVFLARQHFYDCIIFHRVIPSFVDQTGDPTGTGEGGPGYQFADELPKKASPQYPLGSVAMANSGPNTNGSQFFVVAGSQGESLAPSYSLFGQVTSGMSVIDKINTDGTSAGTPTVTHRMISVTINES